MSISTRQTSFFRVFLSLAIVLLVAIGCSENPISPVEESSEPQVLGRSASSSSVMLSPTALRAEETISAADGGRLQLADVILEVPPGAVDSDTLFFIEIPDINLFYNDFGTHGLVFNVPVKVTMSYRDADLSSVDERTIRIGWFNEDTGHFQDISCTIDFDTKTVTGYVDHFSAYALISD